MLLGLTLLACGSGKITPAPPSGQFSNASLKGQYAFSISGLDLNAAYFAQIGSFTADGVGHITGGLQDVLNLSTGQPASVVSISGGSYQIQSNGVGTLTLNGSDGSVLQLSLTLQSPSTGFLIETDLNAATSGSVNLQTSSNFSTSALAFPYVFQLSGVSFQNSTAAPIAMIGQTVLNGSGGITGGVMDTNDGHSETPSGATAISPGTYALDGSNGSSFGRGALSFSGRTFAFYIVDSTHFKMLEEDTLGGDAGDAWQQAATIPTENAQFSGSFVYLIGAGVSTLGSEGPVDRVARFTSDGSGNISAVSLDDNNDGLYTHISQGSNISAATYSIDSTYTGSGRGTFTFKASGQGTFVDVFYMISPTQGVVSETSRGIIGTGPILAQSGGPFTLSNAAGTFVTLWTGEQLSYQASVPYAEEYVAHYTLGTTNSSNISGVISYVELGISSKTVYAGEGLAGTLTINSPSTNNNHYQFAVGGPSPVTVNFQAYFVNASTVLMVCSDSTRTTAGMIVAQQ